MPSGPTASGHGAGPVRHDGNTSAVQIAESSPDLDPDSVVDFEIRAKYGSDARANVSNGEAIAARGLPAIEDDEDQRFFFIFSLVLSCIRSLDTC